VSTLTPSQLARKRANDREAQRAIRARTKEHIERLEREIEELKSRYSRDETVQELLRRNKALEQELATLRETLGLQAGRTYPPTRKPGISTSLRSRRCDETEYQHMLAYQETISAAGSGVSSRTSSFGQNSGEYSAVPGFGSPYIPTSEPCEPWTPGLNYAPSVVSSPTSSVGNADDYTAGYIPTSMPTSMMNGRAAMPQTSVPCIDKGRKLTPCV
jgi:regulator of replication initiation timing